jgi:hypothetical protein
MQDKTDTHAPKASRPSEDFPYRIDLWRAEGEDGVERALARAASMALARAILKAARGEHPDRRITLSKGNRIVSDSAE